MSNADCDVDGTEHIREAREALAAKYAVDVQQARRDAEALAKIEGCDFAEQYRRGHEATLVVIRKYVDDDEALRQEGVRLRLKADAVRYSRRPYDAVPETPAGEAPPIGQMQMLPPK